ncbi:hypothetical protein CEQ83_26545 (plasmid) [Priestia megaterium]|uniref:hypothetical protein n=1 Tax=Priestia megaterium TaxID=1404 RepID=UPI0012A91BDC|nr:hypothetical protein [Priestia megaterium]QFY76103.1 hypothetical protein CEQ83_26545 [Priestia megaterium]
MIKANVGVHNREKFELDSGKRNIGFKFSEAIMESTDDSFDASISPSNLGAPTIIEIYVSEEEYEEYTEDGNVNKSKRYSYSILDNGPGVCVDNVFEFGQNKNDRFTDLNALNTLNGLYHYGLSSHLNVGTKLYFYSRETDRDWSLNCLEASDITDEVYTYKKEAKPNIEVDNQQLDLDDFDFFVRTVVQVKGVRKSEVEEKNLEELVKNLIKQFGVTYKHYIQRGNKIFINGTEVRGIDPFLCEKEYKERGISSDLFHKFNITLRELLEQEDAIVKQKILNNYGKLFNSNEELLNESINVSMYELCSDFLDRSFKSKIAEEMSHCLLPSIMDSGFYIKRNHRYIGRAAKILDICKNHNSYNYFRAEISFSPIFDMFFGIQINKNKYDIKSSLASLMIKKINLETKGKNIPNYLKTREKDSIKQNSLTLLSKLIVKAHELEKYIYQLDIVRAEARERGIDSDLILEAREFMESSEKFNQYLTGLTNEYDDLLKLNEVETNIVQDALNEAKKLFQNATEIIMRIKNAISLRDEQLIEPANLLKNRVRVAANTNRRLIGNEDFDYLNAFKGFILEPLNEVQTYGVLYNILHHFPNEFEFILLDYSEDKGIDCVVKIRDAELYNNLNLKARFENQWELDWDEYLNNNKGAFSFVELKYKLGAKEDLGHSLTLVSHLICWDFHENNLDEFKAVDGKYKLSNDKRYLFHKDKMKKVKVICLREMVERLIGEEFYASKDYFNSYLSR